VRIFCFWPGGTTAPSGTATRPASTPARGGRSYRLRSLIQAVAAVLVLCAAVSAGAVIHTYTEDFTTRAYCDTLETTALWDTLAGTLSLPPFQPVEVGDIPTPDRAFGVATDGSYAFVAAYTSGLIVIDISDPEAPFQTGSYDTPGRAYDVAISGDYAYVADYASGLQVVAISDPAHPAYAGSYATAGKAYGVEICGDIAYVADEDSGIVAVDITDPSNPALAGSYNTPGQAYGLEAAGDYLYVADGLAGLAVLDISSPSSPAPAGGLDTPGEGLSLTIDADFAYVADGDSGVRIIDISDPLSPAWVATCPTPGRARHIMISGRYAYVADGAGGLAVIDISSPAAPLYVTGFDTPGEARGISIHADYACLADDTSGFRVIKIANLLPAPFTTGHHPTLDMAYGVAVAGRYAYVGTYSAGLTIFDISDPSDPTQVGSVITPGNSNNVKLSGDYAYVADWEGGLQVIDISDPANPFIAGGCTVTGYPIGVDVAGDYAYLASGTFGGISVVDISDPANPVHVATAPTPGATRAVAVAGDYAYAADMDSGLQVIDISDPLNPARIASCNTPGVERGLAVSGNYAYLGADRAGLTVVDISDPLNPVHVATCDTPGLSRRVAAAGRYVFVADHEGGLQIVDVSDPTTPFIAASAPTTNHAHGVAVAGDFAFVADWEGGFQQIQVFERGSDIHLDRGQSTAVCATDEPINLVRVSTEQTGSLAWEVSADSGLHWDAMPADSNWHRLQFPGRHLLWRSAHEYDTWGVNPGCSLLRIACWEEVTSHTMDGDLDPNHMHVASGDLNLYADFNGEYLYVATEGVAATTGWDHFILIADDLSGPLGAPWSKAGTVAGRALYLAGEDAGGACGWFDSTETEIGAEKAACACGAFLEGVVSLDSVFGTPLPDTLYIAVGAYESPDGGVLTGQAPAGDADGDIEPGEYVIFSPGVSGVDQTGRADGLMGHPAIVGVQPNPSRVGADVLFSVPHRCMLSIGVFDVTGRQVGNLTRSQWGPGLHSLHWNAEAVNGNRIPPGLYFVCLRTGRFRDTEKVIILR
jgi:hypothetical protein